jgi:hypothetical protein
VIPDKGVERKTKKRNEVEIVEETRRSKLRGKTNVGKAKSNAIASANNIDVIGGSEAPSSIPTTSVLSAGELPGIPTNAVPSSLTVGPASWSVGLQGPLVGVGKGKGVIYESLIKFWIATGSNIERTFFVLEVVLLGLFIIVIVCLFVCVCVFFIYLTRVALRHFLYNVVLTRDALTGMRVRLDESSAYLKDVDGSADQDAATDKFGTSVRELFLFLYLHFAFCSIL